MRPSIHDTACELLTENMGRSRGKTRQRLSRVGGHESDEAFIVSCVNFESQLCDCTCDLEHLATLLSEMVLQSPHCFLRVDFFAFPSPSVPPGDPPLTRAPRGLQAMLKEGGMEPAPN